MPRKTRIIALDRPSPYLKALKMTAVMLVLLSTLTAVQQAIAEPKLTGNYAGGFYSASDQHFDFTDLTEVKRSRGHLKLKMGMPLNDYIDLEGQLGATTELGSNEGLVTYGGYFRFYKDFEARSYKAYGLLGFSGSEDMNDATKASAVGLSYGFGFEIFGSKNLSLGIEVIRHYDTSWDEAVLFRDGVSRVGDKLTFDTFGIGITYYFQTEGSAFDRNRDKIDSIRY